jgi:putative MATE family efflux protein
MRNASARQILRLALPLILQQLCLQLQVWIDRAMLGHVNAEFFSAIGNTTVPYHMVTSVITAICGGTAILVAQGIGAGDRRQVRETAECSFLGNSLLSAAAFCFFLFGSGWLFRMMGVQSPILEHSTAYIRILSLTLLILGPTATATSVLQGLGFTRVIMLAGITSNLLNILLDWILIFGKLGFPALGISGAAWATVLSNAIAAPVTVLYVLRSPKMPVKLQLLQSPARQLARYRRVLDLGIPSGLEYLLWNAANLVLVSFLNRLDMMSAGIYTLVFSIETVPLLIYMGFANAGLTMVGQNTGARDPRQAQRTGFLCLSFSLAICAVVAVLFRLFPRQILLLFTDDPSILEVSVPYLIFVTWVLFPKAVNNVIGLCIRGMGDTRWMLYTQIFGTVFMIGAGYWLILGSGLGLKGIFITLLADEALRGVANLLRFSRKPRDT